MISAAEHPPLLLLDVDGPLNPYAARPERRPEGYLTYRMLPASWVAADAEQRNGKPLRVWLNHDHGPRLLALPYTLVWATTWMHDANEWISPRLGLPSLPVIAWPEMHRTDPDGIHWKTRHVVDWAAGRAFAWVDDEISDRDREWVRDHHQGPALLLTVDARRGLRDDDFAVLAAWRASLPDEASTPAGPITAGDQPWFEQRPRTAAPVSLGDQALPERLPTLLDDDATAPAERPPAPHAADHPSLLPQLPALPADDRTPTDQPPAPPTADDQPLSEQPPTPPADDQPLSEQPPTPPAADDPAPTDELPRPLDPSDQARPERLPTPRTPADRAPAELQPTPVAAREQALLE